MHPDVARVPRPERDAEVLEHHVVGVLVHVVRDLARGLPAPAVERRLEAASREPRARAVFVLAGVAVLLLGLTAERLPEREYEIPYEPPIDRGALPPHQGP